MRQKRRAVVKLQPADAAVILQIFSDACFVDAKMVGRKCFLSCSRLRGFTAAAA